MAKCYLLVDLKMQILLTIVNWIRDPSSQMRFASYRKRQIFRVLQNFIFCRSEIAKRKSALDLIFSDPICKIDEATGYNMVDGEELQDVVSEAIKEVKSLLSTVNVSEMVRGKKYLISVLPNDGLGHESRILKLATTPSIVKTVGAYLGCLPVLTYVNVWYSRPTGEASQAEGSQMWHLDHEDLRQMKVFIYCDDVDERCGPLKVVSAKASLDYVNSLNYRTVSETKRLSDDAISAAEHITLTGKQGSLAFVDTSRCFHLGSREMNKPRLVIALQYLGPQAYGARNYHNPYLQKKIASSGHSFSEQLSSFG